MKYIPLSAAMTLTALVWAAGALEGQRPGLFRSTADDRQEVSITVYNQNFGLVREVRDLRLGEGLVAIEFRDVAASIQPETVHIMSRVRSDLLRVLEQNYQYDLLNPQKLLEKYVGRTVRIYRWNRETEREEALDAEVLSVNGGPILRIGDEITYNMPGRIAFPEVPENLIAQPTLMWHVQSGAPRQSVEVSYLTADLNWKADYVLVIDDAERVGDLIGWVTLTNQSGATYENARLKLVAGDVRRVAAALGGVVSADRMRRAMEQAPQFQEEGFFEYHLYTLQRPTTLRNNEQKQVALLEADGVGIRKEYEFAGAPQYYRQSFGPQRRFNEKVGVYLQIDNTQSNGLGMPLPRGIVRVYKADRSGAQQFVGEDHIDHTPRDEHIRVRLGDAFDLVGERHQMQYRVISSCVSESDWEISLRNRKEEAVTIRLVEPAGGDWQIIRASHELTRRDATSFQGQIPVSAGQEVIVRYGVRVRWC